MTVGYRHLRGVLHKKANPGCSTGGFYKSPTSEQSITSGTNFNISWDTSCLSTDAVDIYLYAPGATTSRIHIWKNVNYALGSYTTQLSSGWWNSTSSVSLQLSIVPSTTAPFLTTLPAGPIFTGKTGSDASVVAGITAQNVNNFAHSSGLSGGKIAAAVILPLLFIGALIFAAWLKYNRAKTQDKHRRFSVAVDKRMSTISTDWKSISAAGATAAIRHSMAISGASGNRASSFSFGNPRPSSTAAVESGQAGIGSRGIYLQGNGSYEKSQLSLPGSVYTGDRISRASLYTDARISRVSFAADTRSMKGEPRRPTRSFHTSHIPPLPILQDTSELSPTQTHGPISLSADDIRARMTGQQLEARHSIDDYIPALSMMRVSGGNEGSDDSNMLFRPQEIQPPSPAPATSKSVVGMMPMQPVPANVMSPDDMLRAYAESRRAAGTPAKGGPTFPSPVAAYDGHGMRTLYSPPPYSTPNQNANHNKDNKTISQHGEQDTNNDAYAIAK